MELIEYLYIDRRRLESYFQQLSAPVTYDKVPEWKASLSLTGPTAEGLQTRQPRPFTEHEKIVAVMRYFFPKKPAKIDHYPFAFETLEARRAFIPSRSTDSSGLKGLAIWLCANPRLPLDQSGSCYLIEDYPKDDASPNHESGMTALWLLFEDLAHEMTQMGILSKPIGPPSIGQQERFEALRLGPTLEAEQIEKSSEHEVNLLGSFYDQVSHSTLDRGMLSLRTALAPFRVLFSENSLICGIHEVVGNDTYKWCDVADGDKRYIVKLWKQKSREDRVSTDISVSRDYRNELAARFAVSGAELLKEWGARIGPQQTIDCLYRIRHTMVESSVPGSKHALIGYPIFIAQNPSSFSE